MRHSRFALIGAVIVAACFLGLHRGLWTPDEPREAGISREMYDRPGVIPTLNGEPFVEKPPLYYWATALSFSIAGGPSVAAARSVSGLSGLLTLAVLFVWVRRARSGATAAVATVLLATFAAFLTSVHWIRIDALLLLFCTLAIWSAWERVGRGSGAGFLVLFYAAVALALWTKGLIGPVLIGAGLVAYAALSRSIGVLAPLRPVTGAVVFAAAVAALAAAIRASGGNAALSEWFWVNHVERFVHPVATGHGRPFAYYFWTLPTAIAPWLVPFVSLLRFKGPIWNSDRTDAALLRFAAAMTIAPLVVLTLASSKREVYLLPLLPALALLMATTVEDRIQAETALPRPGTWTRVGDWVQAAILGLIGVAPATAHIVVSRTVTPASAALLIAGLASAAALCVAVARRALARAFAIGASSIGVALAGVAVLVVPKVDALKDLRPFIASVDTLLPAGTKIPAVGADETLLGIVSFVTGRTVVSIDARDVDGAAFVLVQSDGQDVSPDALSPAYERIASAEFGPTRRMALWRKRAAP